LHRVEEAREVLKTLVERDSGDREAGLLLAVLFSDDKRYEEAVEVLAKLHRQRPQDREISFRFGSALEQAGAVDSCLAVFDHMLAEDPNDALCLNYTGYLCIDRGIRLEEALSRVQRAVAIDPENGAYLDSYGWGLYRLRRPEEAVEQLRRAAELSPKEPIIHRHLGEVLSSLGKSDEARKALRKARELDPGDPEAKRLLDELEHRKPGQPAN
jgi:Flp pilus assembly protein TadD